MLANTPSPSQGLPPTPTGFFQAWWLTWNTALRDAGVLLLLVGAPLLYAFYYPWFYSEQKLEQVPVAWVDQDHSSLSRQMLRFAQASPRLDVRMVTSDEGQARQAVLNGELQGYALVPPQLQRNVLRGSSATVAIMANGAYPLFAKEVQYGFAEAVGTVSAGVEIRKLQASGQSALQANASRAPLSLQMQALFNPTEGYGSFVVAAVALVILQQTLIMGVGMLVATWREQGRDRTTVRAWLGRLLALCTVGWTSGLLYFGWIFVWHDYPRGGNPLGALVLLLCYVPAIVSMAALLGWWLANRERVMQVMLFTTLPMVFMSGFSWPSEALPEALQWFRWLFPSTAGIQASLRLNQMAAPLHAAWQPLAVLVALCAASLSALLWVNARKPAPR